MFFGFWSVLVLCLVFCCGECTAVFFGHYREHSATSWLEGIALVCFWCFGGFFGAAAILKEVLIGSHSSSLVAFLDPSIGIEAG
jgi:hypothetical protein